MPTYLFLDHTEHTCKQERGRTKEMNAKYFRIFFPKHDLSAMPPWLLRNGTDRKKLDVGTQNISFLQKRQNVFFLYCHSLFFWIIRTRLQAGQYFHTFFAKHVLSAAALSFFFGSSTDSHTISWCKYQPTPVSSPSQKRQMRSKAKNVLSALPSSLFVWSFTKSHTANWCNCKYQPTPVPQPSQKRQRGKTCSFCTAIVSFLLDHPPSPPLQADVSILSKVAQSFLSLLATLWQDTWRTGSKMLELVINRSTVKEVSPNQKPEKNCWSVRQYSAGLVD